VVSSTNLFTTQERRAIRTALTAELARTEEQTASLSRQFEDIVEAAELTNTDDEHDPEGTTIAFERAQVNSLRTQAAEDRAALQASLARMDDDDFGSCERCAGPIGLERLVALPATRRCVECAR
jgi:RNA polymerase-binding transcription factor DksA